MDHVPAIYRDPFSLGSPTIAKMPPGISITEMIGRMSQLPARFEITGEVRINGHAVPRALWGMVKPKATREAMPVVLTFHAPIRGGGGEDGGKSGVALIASIALVVAASAVSGGVLGPTGALALTSSGAFLAAGTTSALIAATAISLVGALALMALTPPPAGLTGATDTGFDRDKVGAASAGGNLLEPNGPIPRVIGTRKIFPPLGAEPFTFYDGEDEWVEAVYVLAGPHDMSDIRIDGTPIEGASDLSFEIREGWLDDPPLNIVQQQTRTSPVQLELSTHQVTASDQEVLETTDASDLPSFHGTAGKNDPDEILLHLTFGGGLSKDGLTTVLLRVPLRIRIRKAGDSTWRNLPELHYENATVRQARLTVKLIFQDGENSIIPAVPATGAFVEARKLAPGQVVSPATDDWTADSYFSSGAGDDYLMLGTEGTSNVLNVTLTKTEANIYLDRAQFLPGIYEIEIMRGVAFKVSSYAVATYFYSGGIRDFFFWRASGSDAKVAETRKNIIDALHLIRTVSVWDELPIQAKGFALIAIKARNRKIDRVSVLASGYVKDWDGNNWITWVTTSNPAPHYRDILVGSLNLDPLPESLVDDTSLVDWRTACNTLDYTCDHIAEGERVFDTQTILAGCGFARRYQSEIWGVIRDFDRSADGPIQIFSPRNSSAFKWSKAFARLPDGLRINFQHEDVDFTPTQLIVYRDDVPGPKLEQVTYEGMPELAHNRRRAEFDLKQASLRSTIYSLTAPAESIVCRRGSLVGVNHDVLHNQAGFGRATSAQTSGGNVTGITLDSDVPVWDETDMHGLADMHVATDMHTIGRTTGVAIRGTDGVTTVHLLSNATGETNVLTFDATVSDDTWAGGPFDGGAISKIGVGCLCVVGNFGSEFKRMVVSEITPGADLTATLTLLDEAPDLFPPLPSETRLEENGTTTRIQEDGTTRVTEGT